LIGKLVLREELEEPSTGSNYTESFFCSNSIEAGKIAFSSTNPKNKSKTTHIDMETTEDALFGKVGSFLAPKKLPTRRRNRVVFGKT